ncbi:MAG: hypothetical protein ACK53Y_12150, partial [bacterium]
MLHTNRLQEKLSSDFTHVVQAQSNFKQEVREELDELCYLISIQNQSSSQPIVPQDSNNVTTPPVVSTTSSIPVVVSSPSVPSLGSTSNCASGQEIQNQMMMMLTESFSKLTSVLVDKNTESKSEWPKFSGDSKKFRAWYMAIMAQLSLPPWKELYDISTNDIVSTTNN